MSSSRQPSIGSSKLTENLALFGKLAAIGMSATPAVDKFGLPLNWWLSDESAEQRLERVKAVIGVVREVYLVAISHLGGDVTREVWKETTKGKIGRPRGRKNPQLDDLMLQAYDKFIGECDEKAQKAAPRNVAINLKRDAPDLFPAIVGSIEQHLRRLIKDRDQDRAAASEANRSLAAALIAIPLSSLASRSSAGSSSSE